jgi:hypothetical protein
MSEVQAKVGRRQICGLPCLLPQRMRLCALSIARSMREAPAAGGAKELARLCSVDRDWGASGGECDGVGVPLSGSIVIFCVNAPAGPSPGTSLLRETSEPSANSVKKS